jgi:hypothetical protein
MYNESKDYDNDGLDVAEAAARPPNWFSYSSYSMQQDQLQDPSYQYPEAGNTGEWYSAPSTSAHTSATSTATGHLDHYTATSSQTALRRAHANPLYYSELGTDGQNPAFAGTAAESAYPTTPLQPEGYYEADSNLTFTGNSASPSTSAPTSFAAYDGYVSSQRPVGSGNTRSGARTLSSRRYEWNSSAFRFFFCYINVVVFCARLGIFLRSPFLFFRLSPSLSRLLASPHFTLFSSPRFSYPFFHRNYRSFPPNWCLLSPSVHTNHCL